MQHKCHIESFHPCIRAMLHESPKSNMVKTTCGQAFVLARKCTLKPSSTDSARVEICWKTWWSNKSWLLPLTKHRSALNWCREVCRFLVHRLGSGTCFFNSFFPTISRQSGTSFRVKEFRAPRFTLESDQCEPQNFLELLPVLKLCEHCEPPSGRISWIIWRSMDMQWASKTVNFTMRCIGNFDKQTNIVMWRVQLRGRSQVLRL